MEFLIRKENILPAYVLYLSICLISSYLFFAWGVKLNLWYIIDTSWRSHAEFAFNFGVASLFFFGAMNASDVKYHPDRFNTNQFVKDILSISISKLLMGGLLTFITGWIAILVGLIAGFIVAIVLAIVFYGFHLILNTNLNSINIVIISNYIVVIALNIHCFQVMFSREENND